MCLFEIWSWYDHDMIVVSCVVQARAKYLSVAKQMKAYEDVQYAQWHHEVESNLPSLLKRNLLAKPEVSTNVTVIIKVDDETGEKSDVDAGWCYNVFYLFSSKLGQALTYKNMFCQVFFFRI